MIHAKTCFVAEGVTIDRDTNQVSAHNLIEDIEASSYPLLIQKLAFFCLWERARDDPAQCRSEFSITLDGEDLLRQPIDIDFGQFLRNRCTSRLEGFTLAKPGTIVFRLAIPDHDAAEWSVTAGLTAPVASGHGAGPRSGGSRNLWQSETVTKSFALESFHRR